MSTLTIVLIVVGVVLVLGGGGCLLCVGLAASSYVEATDEAGAPPGEATGAAAPAGLVRDDFSRDLEAKLRQQGIPATTVMCPSAHAARFKCDLAVNADHAALDVRDTGTGYAFEVPNTAFLDGVKLTTTFQGQVASKLDPRLRVPCFTGTLMKAVASSFTCDVVVGSVKSGDVVVTVNDQKGNVRMDYTGDARAEAPAPPAKKPSRRRFVEITCEGGGPGEPVRAGCLCGSQILGTACGAPGNFTEVIATPRGCRFTCD